MFEELLALSGEARIELCKRLGEVAAQIHQRKEEYRRRILSLAAKERELEKRREEVLAVMQLLSVIDKHAKPEDEPPF